MGSVGYQELIKRREEPVASSTVFFLDGIDLQAIARR